MENLHIEGTDTLPKVDMDISGDVKLEGRALPEDAARFFQPILGWMNEYAGPKLEVSINLEYFNTSVSKQLHDFISLINNKPEDCQVQVLWHYEEGDDEMLESGEIYEELFPRIKFTYHEYEEVTE